MEQAHQTHHKKEKKSPFRRWLKRIWNIIPSRQSLIKGIQFIGKKVLATFQKCFQTCKQTGKDIYKRLKNSLTAFSSYQIKTPYAKANDCPLDELPIIIKVESLGKNGRFFHGAASYKDVVVDSNGEGKNTTKNAKMDDPEDTIGVYFVLYPQKMGLDPQKLLAGMKEEAAKENDYDFYINNCIDHVIRPLKSAGAQIDFGEISTPKELCIWCDQMASQQKAGFVLNEEEYQKLLPFAYRLQLSVFICCALRRILRLNLAIL